MAICLLFCFGSSSCKAQKMKKFYHKTLSAKVGSICEETPDDNPCAGAEIYVLLEFDKDSVKVSEKTESSCDEATVVYKGAYPWKLEPNQVIAIDFASETLDFLNIDTFQLIRQKKQIIGNITHQNGKTEQYIFKEEKRIKN